MGYSISTKFWISSFERAEATYLETKPIRGREDADIRPIGDRRAQHMRMVKINDDTYACRLYNTDVVTYHRNGILELSTGGWDTQSTVAFMSACLPARYRVHKQNNYIHLYDNRTAMYYIMSGRMTVNQNTGEVSGYKIPTKNAVDREATKRRRDPLKPFLKFVKTYVEVLQMEIPEPENYQWLNSKRHELDAYINAEEALPENNYIEYLVALFYYNGYRFGNDIPTYENLKNRLNKLTAVYKLVELPVGSLQDR